MTHTTRADSPETRYTVKATCGRWVFKKQLSDPPTCPSCLRIEAEENEIAESIMAKDTKRDKASLQDRLNIITKTGGKQTGSVMDVGHSPDVDSAKVSLAPTKKTVTKELVGLDTEIEELEIDSPQLYAYADELLGRIQQARGAWSKVWERIQEKTIKPLRSALDGLYETNQEVDGPAAKLEAKLKEKMRLYKLAEQKRLDAEETERNRRAQALIDEAEAKAKAAATAATPQVRGRLEQQAARAATQAQEILDEPTETAEVKAENSSGRRKMVWQITDMAKFRMAFAKDNIPEDVFTLNTVAMNRYFKNDAEGMESWPGVEIVPDITIVGSRK